MYLNFFRLKEEPFNMTPDPRFMFLSRQHEEALESLLYGIEHRKGFMAIIGGIGTGKTTICRTLINRLDDNVDTSVIFNPMLSVVELLAAINEDFGNKSGADDTVKGQLDALNKFLLRRLRWNKNAVVIIDEAQHLSFESFEMLRMLSNLETENKKLLQIIFLGQPELLEKLKSPELAQLSQRISVRYLLGALNYDETCNYVAHRLSIAGADASLKFEAGAMKKVFEVSGGVPRVINKLCDRTLLTAYAERKLVVDKKMVKRANLDMEGLLNPNGADFFKKKRPWFLRMLGFN